MSFSVYTAVTVPGPRASVFPENEVAVWVPEPHCPGTVDLPERRSIAVFRTSLFLIRD